MSPTGKSDSVRFVRACRACGRGEAACARETMLLPRLGCGRSKSPPVSCRVVVARALALPSQNHSLVLRLPVDRC